MPPHCGDPGPAAEYAAIEPATLGRPELALDPPISYYQRLVAQDQDEAADIATEHLATHSPEETIDGLLVPALGIMGVVFALVWGGILLLRRDLMGKMARGELPSQQVRDP